jgi:predicted enzyme related to lactoylglutathione lyase
MATKKAKKRAPQKAAKKAPAKKKTAKKPWHPQVVHWEIGARDQQRQEQFFTELFGWKIDDNNPMKYAMVTSGGKAAIDGGIGRSEEYPYLTVYISVRSINDTLAKAESMGAVTMMQRTDVGPVILGLFRDLEGNVIGLMEDRT